MFRGGSRNENGGVLPPVWQNNIKLLFGRVIQLLRLSSWMTEKGIQPEKQGS